ncbi:MAG: PQQ-like beta-propeller repeat protein [Kofleriaceae bacterium]|nr:PQQ-like beta-propeller repeat protein [Kofleriaceae bacterium]
MNKYLSGALFGVLLGTLPLSLSGDTANATVTATWNVDSYQSFNKGESDAAFVTSLGQVRPGWAVDHTELDFDNAWSAVRADDGTVYIGSDEEATIYKVKGNKVSKLASVGDAVAVVSLALAKDGTLYAGTMPDGEVWAINTQTGKAKELATLKDAETVWSLQLTDSGLYAGTGPEGLLYQIDTKKGSTTLAFDSEDKRIMSLLATGDNAIWIGTSDNALVFRHDLKTKKTRAIADFAGNEVSSMVEWQGNVIVAANDMAPGSSTGFKSKESVDKAAKKEGAGHKAKMPKEGTKPGADPAPNASIEPLAKSLRKGKGAIYRVRGDGKLTQLHALTNSYFSSLAVNSKGQIFAGAANKGQVFMVDIDDSVSTVLDVDQRYIADIMVDKSDKIHFTTGDSAGLYQSSGKAKSSRYTSDVFDAKTPSRFGRLVWHSEGSFSIETRSGNIEKPGMGWSAWQTPSNPLRGMGDMTRGKVQSPPGRYFQYRVRFGADEKAVLSKTKLFYLPANTATRVNGATIEAESKLHGVVTLPAPKAHSPTLKLKWDISNSDDDKTVYELSIRRQGDARYRPIFTGTSPLSKDEFKWNTETTPDGYYRLKITASDHLANSNDRALTSSFTTPLFAVDNERPKIAGVNVRYPNASARASDALSTINEMAFSVDDGPWQIGAPSDGIFDDQSEVLSIDLPSGLAKGTHSLAIRVLDSAGNMGSSTTSFSL